MSIWLSLSLDNKLWAVAAGVILTAMLFALAKRVWRRIRRKSDGSGYLALMKYPG